MAIEVVLPTSSGFAVVQLNSVIVGGMDSVELPLKQQYARVIANGSASLENSALMRQLRAAANVEVFEDRLK